MDYELKNKIIKYKNQYKNQYKNKYKNKYKK